MSNMLFSVHGYFKKTNTRKMPRKLEVLVYATDDDSALKLVENLFSRYYNADLFIARTSIIHFIFHLTPILSVCLYWTHAKMM